MAEAIKQAESPQKDTKPRHRSPNYPGIGLRIAVTKITTLYQKDGLAPAMRDAALKHLGYDKMHGEAGRILSALKSFGLIEEMDDRIKLTQRGIDIVARQEPDAQRATALREAATGPAIYRELIRDYKASGLPSDITLKSELIAGKRFNPKAVEDFVKDFKDSLEFSGISDLGTVELGSKDEDVTPAPETKSPPPKGRVAPPPPAQFPPTLLQPAGTRSGSGLRPNMQQDVFTLTEGPVTIQWPESLSPESYEDLGDWLDIMKRKIGRSIKDLKQAQKNRIVQAVNEVHPGAVVKFEDHGPFIWFRVTTSDGTVTLIPYSEDRDAEFYERLSYEELRHRLQSLSNQKL